MHTSPLRDPCACPARWSRPSVIERSALEGTVAGPAIINQMDTTTLVPPGWQAFRRVAAGALVA